MGIALENILCARELFEEELGSKVLIGLSYDVIDCEAFITNCSDEMGVYYDSFYEQIVEMLTDKNDVTDGAYSGHVLFSWIEAQMSSNTPENTEVEAHFEISDYSIKRTMSDDEYAGLPF